MSSHHPSDQVPDYGQHVPPAEQNGAPGQPGQPGQYGPPAGQPGYQGQYPPQGQPTPGQPLSPADTKTWAGLSHLLGGILGFLAPLVIWLVFRERSVVVDAEAKKALNFQILVLIVLVAANLVPLGFLSDVVGFAAWAVSIVFGILNFQAFNNGRVTKYPVDVTFVK